MPVVHSRRGAPVSYLRRAQAWLLYEHARNLSTFHDMHAVMAFAAMANGVEDDAESDLWRSRAETLLLSMREYVSSGGSRPPPPPPPPPAHSDTDADDHCSSTPPPPSLSTQQAQASQQQLQEPEPVTTLRKNLETSDGGGSGGGNSCGVAPSRSPSPPLQMPPPAKVVQLHSFPARSPPAMAPAMGGRGGLAAGIGGKGGGGGGGAGEGAVAAEGGGGGAGPPPDNLWVAEHVGLPLCEAMVAYRGVRGEVVFRGVFGLVWRGGRGDGGAYSFVACFVNSLFLPLTTHPSREGGVLLRIHAWP